MSNNFSSSSNNDQGGNDEWHVVGAGGSNRSRRQQHHGHGHHHGHHGSHRGGGWHGGHRHHHGHHGHHHGHHHGSTPWRSGSGGSGGSGSGSGDGGERFHPNPHFQNRRHHHGHHHGHGHHHHHHHDGGHDSHHSRNTLLIPDLVTHKQWLARHIIDTDPVRAGLDSGSGDDSKSDEAGKAGGAHGGKVAPWSYVLKNCKHFEAWDTFNDGMRIAGLQVKQDGYMSGSLYILAVNNQLLEEPQLIHGMPHMYEPFEHFEHNLDDLIKFDKNEAESFYLANRHGGFSVTLFKYTFEGKTYLSAKSPLAPFLYDKPHSHTHLMAQTKHILGLERTFEPTPEDESAAAAAAAAGEEHKADALATKSGESTDAPRVYAIRFGEEPVGFPDDMGAWIKENLPENLHILADPEVQSVTCQLTGPGIRCMGATTEESTLHPVFATTTDGRVRPVVVKEGTDGAVGPRKFSAAALREACAKACADDEAANAAFAQAKELSPQRYEWSNFATEGRTLIVTGKDGAALGRAVYHLMPPTFAKLREQVYAFDDDTKQAIDEYVEEHEHSLPHDDKSLSYELRQRLQPGLLQWSRNERTYVEYAKLAHQRLTRPPHVNADIHHNATVLIMVGLPGSGKSHAAQELVRAAPDKWVRINQDTLGSRKACELAARQELAKGEKHVVIDRTNIDYWQRSHFIRIAQQLGVRSVHCVFLDMPVSLCKQRVVSRTDHPTLPPIRDSVFVVDNFRRSFMPPVLNEGFDSIKVVSKPDDIAAVIAEWAAVPSVAELNEDRRLRQSQQAAVASTRRKSRTKSWREDVVEASKDDEDEEVADAAGGFGLLEIDDEEEENEEEDEEEQDDDDQAEVSTANADTSRSGSKNNNNNNKNNKKKNKKNKKKNKNKKQQQGQQEEENKKVEDEIDFSFLDEEPVKKPSKANKKKKKKQKKKQKKQAAAAKNNS